MRSDNFSRLVESPLPSLRDGRVRHILTQVELVRRGEANGQLGRHAGGGGARALGGLREGRMGEFENLDEELRN